MTPPESNLRPAEDLGCGWRFRFEPPRGAEQPGYDDSSWATVDLPHTWNGADGADGDNHYARGAGWYRLRFRAPPAAAQARRILYFDGVSLVGTVWLNGHELGTHWGGHSAFCYDATEALVQNGENLLVVCADNGWRDDVPPREGDFTLFGGVYRAARLVTTSDLAIDCFDHASPGVYLATPEATRERGLARARVRVNNSAPHPRQATVSVKLLDARGNEVTCAEVNHRALPGVTEAVLELTVEHPRLWHGRVDPYLYQTVVEVAEQGQILDRVRQPLGFRTFSVDPEQGFILNGEAYELRGVNLHQDRAGKGWAVTREEREEDFCLILELGCTFVRLVHYQHDQHAHDLCDRLGLVAWAEHGLVNTVSESPLFGDRCATQLTELIRQSHNHPSIVCWGIGNEVQPHALAARSLLRRLSALVKAEDPTRPSTLATCFDELPGAYGNELLAHNQYFGWYRGEFADFPRWLDAMRAQAPGASIGVSEYGAGAGPSLHSDAPRALDHTEEHQCLFHEAYWRALRARRWVWCRAVWQMFDAASDGRSEGEGPGINDKGLVTRDRGIKKDAFFWYQATWTDEPMVYLTSRRFTPRTEAKADVKVYSNCTAVELCLNGSSLGIRPVEDHVARFDGVTLGPGKNRLQAYARTRGIEVRDVCEWLLEQE